MKNKSFGKTPDKSLGKSLGKTPDKSLGKTQNKAKSKDRRRFLKQLTLGTLGVAGLGISSFLASFAGRRAWSNNKSNRIPANILTPTSARTPAPTLARTPSKAKAKTSFRWRMVMAVPKTLPVWGLGMQQFARRVKDLSEGQLDIRIYGAGELVPGMEVLDTVRKGKVEMGHSAAYYWIGKMPVAAFFCAVPFGMSAQGMRAWLQYGGGQKLWDKLYAQQNLVVFPCGSTSMQMGGWFKKPIQSIKDFKGLKMRIPGLGAKVLQKLKAQPILVPGGEVFTNLATGVIDAAEWVGPYHDYIMGLYKAAKYYYYPGWHEPGPLLELLIHQKAWNSLPPRLQKVLQVAIKETDQNIAVEWLAKDAEYLEKIQKKKNIQILSFPPEVLEALHTQSQVVQKEIAATDSFSQEVYNSFHAFHQRMNRYHHITTLSYLQAKAKAKAKTKATAKSSATSKK